MKKHITLFSIALLLFASTAYFFQGKVISGYKLLNIKFDELTKDELISYLRHKKHRLRHKATDEILKRGLDNTELLDIVLGNLNHLDSSSFCTGVNILKKLKQANANIVEKLIASTRSEDWHIRSCSARGLGIVGKGNKQSFDQLMLLLKDESGLVRESAMEAIVQYGDLAKAAIPFFIKNIYYSQRDYLDGVYVGSAYYGVKALELLPEIDPFNKQAIEALLLQVERPEFFSNNKTASKSLAKMFKTNPEIIDIVAEKLKSDGAYARVLFELDTDRATDLIIQSMDSASKSIRLKTSFVIADVAPTFKSEHKGVIIDKCEKILQSNIHDEYWEGATVNIVYALVDLDRENVVLREFLEASLNKGSREKAEFILKNLNAKEGE